MNPQKTSCFWYQNKNRLGSIFEFGCWIRMIEFKWRFCWLESPTASAASMNKIMWPSWLDYLLMCGLVPRTIHSIRSVANVDGDPFIVSNLLIVLKCVIPIDQLINQDCPLKLVLQLAPDGLAVADERDTLEKQKCRAAEPRAKLAGAVGGWSFTGDEKIMYISFRKWISNVCLCMHTLHYQLQNAPKHV